MKLVNYVNMWLGIIVTYANLWFGIIVNYANLWLGIIPLNTSTIHSVLFVTLSDAVAILSNKIVFGYASGISKTCLCILFLLGFAPVIC